MLLSKTVLNRVNEIIPVTASSGVKTSRRHFVQTLRADSTEFPFQPSRVRTDATSAPFRQSVVFPAHPLPLVEVPPSAVQGQATSVAVHVCLVGFPVCVGGEAGLVRVLFAVGGVGLIKARLQRVTSGPRYGIVEVAPYSDALIAQPVPVGGAPVMLALCRTPAQASVIQLSVTQAAVADLPLPRAAQAGVLDGAAAPEGEVIQVEVQEAALRTGQGHEAALCVPTPEVVVVTRGRVGRRAKEGGVFGVRASRHQVIVLLGADDVVDVGRGGVVARARRRGAHLGLVLFRPAVVHRDAQSTTKHHKRKKKKKES